jgi:hypothetical protein
MLLSLSKLFFISIFVLLFSETYCQNLSFGDLKYLFEHNVETADTYILKKGFKYHEAQKGENGKCDVMVWSYDRNATNNRAFSFVAKNCYDANFGFIWYQFGDKPTFESIKTYCKSIGMKPSKTETSPFNDLCTTYENSIYKVKFCSGLNTGTNLNEYTIKFQEK